MKLDLLQYGSPSSLEDLQKAQQLLVKAIVAVEGKNDLEPALDVLTDNAIIKFPGLPPTLPTRESKRHLINWVANSGESLEFSLHNISLEGEMLVVKLQVNYKFNDGSVKSCDFIASFDRVPDGSKFSSATGVADVSDLMPLWVKHAGVVPAIW
ncbi:hypothetical protein FA15DRAFT_759769 [Coprinopsis marcescibilis]|uniref:SnoaL-like domain-containing protein n=1 Tax=Coprinopsis marcescibilis TaxID=230819 RepID=A0A5C3KIL4_COPMA|nr:hypothetical protein FA15DRAFT_759769 [Coprinopsis marcescibilis]